MLSPVEAVVNYQPSERAVLPFNGFDSWPARAVFADLIVLNQVADGQHMDVVRVHANCVFITVTQAVMRYRSKSG